MRAPGLWVLAVVLWMPWAGWAQEVAPGTAPISAPAAPERAAQAVEAPPKAAEPGATQGAPAVDTPVAQQPATPAEPSLDFDLLDEEPKPDAAAQAAQAAQAERIEKMVSTRRTMLTLHQGLGMATLVGLAGTSVVGQLAFNDKYRGGGATDRWFPLHVGLLATTTALFTTVGMLGVLAPVPYEKKFRLDTAAIHKLFMSVAALGMLTQLVLGLVTRNSDGRLYQVDLATAHQVIGYTTLGAMTAGTLTLFF